MKTQYEAAQERFQPNIPWKPEYAMQPNPAYPPIDYSIPKEHNAEELLRPQTVTATPAKGRFHFRITPMLWSACVLFSIVGLYAMHRGGWSHVVACPFPIQLVREVYHTNEVYATRPHDEIQSAKAWDTVVTPEQIKVIDIPTNYLRNTIWLTNNLTVQSNMLYFAPTMITNFYTTNYGNISILKLLR